MTTDPKSDPRLQSLVDYLRSEVSKHQVMVDGAEALLKFDQLGDELASRKAAVETVKSAHEKISAQVQATKADLEDIQAQHAVTKAELEKESQFIVDQANKDASDILDKAKASADAMHLEMMKEVSDRRADFEKAFDTRTAVLNDLNAKISEAQAKLDLMLDAHEDLSVKTAQMKKLAAEISS